MTASSVWTTAARFATGLALAGPAAVLVAGLLKDRGAVFDLAFQFASPALTVAVVLALAAAALRAPRLAGVAAVVCLGLWLSLRPQWSPEHPPALPTERPVVVYFANVFWENHDVERIAASVAEAKPDVVAMVEVTRPLARNLDRLLPEHPYRTASTPSQRYENGPRTLIASRWPVRVLASERRDGLAVVEAEVARPEGALRVVAVHLTRPWPFDDPEAQSRQIERLSERLRADSTDRLILVGDFNATPSGALLSRFAEDTGLRPAPAVLGTWPESAPAPLRIGIDNLFVGDGLTVESRRLGRPTGSDHRPIVALVAPVDPY